MNLLKKVTCITIFLFAFEVCSAQNIFQKAIYGMSLFQAITKPTADNGCILVGCNYSPAQDWDVFLIKMNANGDSVWTRTYQHPGMNDTGEDVIQTIDGGFFVVASGFVMKTDSTGHPVWAKQIYASTNAYNAAATESPDGDILIVSSAYDSSIPTHRIILTKLDSSGNLLFVKTFGNFSNPRANCVTVTNDGGYIIAGETHYASSATDAILIKTDSLGTFMWAHQYGGNGQDRFIGVEQTAGGDYLALGGTLLHAGSFFVKVDSVGTLIWANTYTGGSSTCDFGMLSKTTDQNFVFCDDDATMGKMDSNGVILWAKSYMPGVQSNGKRFNSIMEAHDGGLIASGLYIEVPWDGFLYLVKSDSTGPNPCYANTVSLSQISVQSKDSSIICTSSTGVIGSISITEECFCDSSHFLCTGVGIFENDLPYSLTVSPNPFSSRMVVNYENNNEAEIILFEISGRKVMQQKFKNSVSLNTEQLAKGIYFYEVQNNNGILKKGKVVKE